MSATRSGIQVFGCSGVQGFRSGQGRVAAAFAGAPPHPITSSPHQPTLPVPRAWLPAAPVRRVILHWTAGGPAPSFIDRTHYHLLIDAAGRLHRGHVPIGGFPGGPRLWPPHTRRLNTGSVGIALCGMRGATRAPFHWGPAPLTAAQVAALGPVVAQVLHRYGLPPTERTCLTHCEVTTTYGIVQRGKWDISVLPAMRAAAPHPVGAHLRQLVRLHWRALPAG